MADSETPPEIDPGLAAKDLIELKHVADALSRSAGNYRPADAVSALEELQRRAGAAVAKIGTDMPDDVRLWAKGIERDAGKALDAARKWNPDELKARLEQISSNADYAANGIQSMPPTPETTSPGVDVVDVVDLTSDAAPSSPPVVQPSTPAHFESAAPPGPPVGEPNAAPAPAHEPSDLDEPPDLDGAALGPVSLIGTLGRVASDPDYGIPPSVRRAWEAGPETVSGTGNVSSTAPTHPSAPASPMPAAPASSAPHGTDAVEPTGQIEHLREVIRSFEPESGGYFDDAFGIPASPAAPSAPSPHASPAPQEQSVVPTVLSDPDVDAMVAEAHYEEPGIWNPDPALEPETPYDPPGEEFV